MRPDPGLAVLRDGRTLLGGTPYRLVRLTANAVPVIGSWLDGKPVGDRGAAGLLARRLVEAGMMHPVPPPHAPRPSVTFVVPVRDRADQLARCLTGLRGGPEVIVVDDGSADPGAVADIARQAGARLVRRPANGGPAAARNTGLAHATTELVAFVDSDCLPRPGWVEPLLPHFADPAVAAVAPRIVAHRPGTGQPATPGAGLLATYEADCSALDMGPGEAIVRPGSTVPYVPSAALIVRRSAVGGGFDASMRVGEDVDLVWRLGAAGHHIRYDPSVAVAHQHRTRPRQWLAQRVQYGTSAAPLAARHPGVLPAASMAGWSAAAWALALARRPVAGALVTAGTTALLARKLSSWSDTPWRTAVRLSADGTLRAGEHLGRTLSRAWWPVALPLALAVPRLRLPLAAATVTAPLIEYRRVRPTTPVVPWTAIRLADDVAYSLGVWQGCVRHRTTEPLRPALWWRSADGITRPPSVRG
ncbi:mycofactocin system glycosyltransferase [Streptomyces sp. YC537]|uniref:Mycofactocin system glycosyltransferase n=1 Tax=Streptomyces boluensis TaxID=1775135 RepID=A0A964UIZ1_9ACTN|nr:mycofactocin system glycosyltransferase [Streptomyces boluensis]